MTVKQSINSNNLNRSNRVNTTISNESKLHDLKFKMETIKRNKQEIQSFSRELTWNNDKWNKNDISGYDIINNKNNDDNPFLNCHQSTIESQSNNIMINNDIQVLIDKLQQTKLNFDENTINGLSKLNTIIDSILKNKQ